MDSLQEKIAKRAYELFLSRGGQHGYHIQDWAQAEREILAEEEAAKKKTKVKDALVAAEQAKPTSSPVKEQVKEPVKEQAKEQVKVPEVEKNAEVKKAKSSATPAKKKVAKKESRVDYVAVLFLVPSLFRAASSMFWQHSTDL